MITKAYLVLSVKEINRLQRVAKRNQKANQSSKPSHCVVLHLEISDQFANTDPDGEQQVQSSSFSWATSVLEQDTKVLESIRLK